MNAELNSHEPTDSKTEFIFDDTPITLTVHNEGTTEEIREITFLYSGEIIRTYRQGEIDGWSEHIHPAKDGEKPLTIRRYSDHRCVTQTPDGRVFEELPFGKTYELDPDTNNRRELISIEKIQLFFWQNPHVKTIMDDELDPGSPYDL